MIPFLVFFLLTFFKQPFLPPRPFRHCLMFAMGWFAFFTILGEVLAFFDYIPRNPPDPDASHALGRIFMYVGWLSFIPLIQICRFARRHELKK